MTPKEKIVKVDFIKIKIFRASKGIIEKVEMQSTK